jgi:hypothetical protein
VYARGQAVLHDLPVQVRGRGDEHRPHVLRLFEQMLVARELLRLANPPRPAFQPALVVVADGRHAHRVEFLQLAKNRPALPSRADHRHRQRLAVRGVHGRHELRQHTQRHRGRTGLPEKRATVNVGHDAFSAS